MRTKAAFSFFGILAIGLVLLVNADAFFVITTLLILSVTSKSLKQLFIVNFASDETYERFISGARVMQTKRDVLLSRAIIFCLNALFILFFVYTFFIATSSVLKIMAIIITVAWSYDVLKTIGNIVAPKDPDSSWSWRDSLSEIFMWLHNITSIVFTVILFTVKFPIFA